MVVDRIPRDFAAEPGVWEALQKHYDNASKEEILHRFDIDCRVVSYDSRAFYNPPNDSKHYTTLQAGPWQKILPDGTVVDLWGARRKTVANEYGSYLELSDYPLSTISTLDELKRYRWPDPRWWDFTKIREVIAKVNPNNEYFLRYRIGSVFETAWSLRGMSSFLCDLIATPEISGYIMDRILEIHLENLDRVLETASDLIDIVYLYDDIAHQTAMLMSTDTWHQTIAKRQKVLFDKAREYGKPVMYHSCGAIRPVIEELIAMGVTLLSPIQPQAADMDFDELKNEYGEHVCFHGGIDIQHLLPHGTPEEIRAEVKRAEELLGKGGGYILAPAHHIQSDTPIENILAMYES